MNPIRKRVFTGSLNRSRVSWAWIDPDGKMYYLLHKNLTHAEWAARWFEKKEDEVPKRPMLALTQKGWAAATNQLNYLVGGPDLPDRQAERIMSILEGLVFDSEIDPFEPELITLEWRTGPDLRDFRHQWMSVDEFIGRYGGKRRLEKMYHMLEEA